MTLSAALKIQATIQLSRNTGIVTLHTIFKVSSELRNDFIGEKLMVHEIGNPEDSDMRGFTVVDINYILTVTV